MNSGLKSRGIKSTIVYSNDDPALTFSYFSSKVKSYNLSFYLGKCDNDGIFEFISACDFEVW